MTILKWHDTEIGETGASTLWIDFPVKIPIDVDRNVNQPALGTSYHQVSPGFDAYYVAMFESDTLAMFKINDGIIPAETGVVIKGKPGTYRILESPDAGTAVESKLIGTVSEGVRYKGDMENNYYMLTDDPKLLENGPIFVRAELDYSIDAIPYNAYLHLTFEEYNNPKAIKSLVKIYHSGGYDPEEDPTVIEKIEQEDSSENSFYNLNGQKVEKDYKGIKIRNGKKVMLNK